MCFPRALRALLALPVAWIGTGSPAVAQEEAGPSTMHYVADYKVGYDDLSEWTEDHHEHAAPLLDALVEEGVITGWSAWQHNTGSDYNWRLVIEADEWADFGAFWDEYLGRLPEEALEAGAGMIRAHRDQVWDQADARIPESAAAAPWAYEALYQVDFDDLEAWREHWETTVVPLLEQAMADGILAGWVVDAHDTGGRFNRAEVYFFEDWDHIDDFWDWVLGELMADEERWERLAGMIRAHDDVIWERVPAGME